MNLNSVIYFVKHANIKTLYFNLKYFSFSVALKLPVFIHRKVVFKNIKGTIILPAKIYPGIIKIGFGDVGIFDKKYSRTIWEVSGKVSFAGSANIGHGSKISVGEKGNLYVGERFVITAESELVCFHEISFGNDCLLSWNILMMDTDFHKIYQSGIRINENSKIQIGNKVWIGARSTILKGSFIADGAVIASNSLVAGKLNIPNAVYAGQPAILKKENIEWDI
jgi:acetyltransferase-like isoleucine patch superfamily enzyme